MNLNNLSQKQLQQLFCLFLEDGILNYISLQERLKIVKKLTLQLIDNINIC